MTMIFNPQWLETLIHEAPDRAGKTIRKIAREMGGIDEKYLARQINPNDTGAKLGLVDFVFYSAVTDLEPLDYINQALDRISVPMPPDAAVKLCDVAKTAAQAVKEFGELMTAYGGALADGNIDQQETEETLKEGYEALRAIALFIRTLEEHKKNL